ncbi:hypothetical protein PHET_06253 [Paragonimus heterotremus]|uniref:Uncharacterized protein n=1 Tax=Paragonimus heterotremus TaxID=100268 RepID=A0A8J4TDZ8_9TREM|nr:hypothetical protein PHET_06253 [Paragonimus heterotremus]
MQTHTFSSVCIIADICLNHVSCTKANCIALLTSNPLTTRVFKRQHQLHGSEIHIQHNEGCSCCHQHSRIARRRTGPSYTSSQNTHEPKKLVQENKTAQVQTDVCSQQHRFQQISLSLYPYQIPDDTGSTTIRVDGPLYKEGVRLKWDKSRKFDEVTKEVGENVRTQFTRFLNLNPNNGSHINTEQHKIYEEPMDKTLTRMAAQITFNNSMLAANGINYTCPPFKQLVKASLDSLFSTAI